MSFVMSTAQSAAVPLSGSGEPTAANAWLTPVELLVLGAIWGASFLFQRVAAPDFGAFALVEVRFLLRPVVLAPFFWFARTQFNTRLMFRLAGIAVINSAVPFVLFAWAAQRAPAGVG